MRLLIRWVRSVKARLGALGNRGGSPASAPVIAPAAVNAVAETAIATARQAWFERGHRLVEDILAGHRRLVAHRAMEPAVSVIIVVHNKAALSALAIESMTHQLDAPHELIVVDNASSDETVTLLDAVQGLRVLRFEQNLGFGPACNLAAGQARGEFLLFFNNDALLQPGALGAALAVFAEEPWVGAVGGKIVLSDGSLQELGAFVWEDGLTAGYGRGEDPQSPDYSIRLAADYVSGAFLLTPRALFESVGGFDARYAPAYYEDVDYCVELWTRGYAVIVEPKAVVCHYESATSLQTKVSLSAINRSKFCDKWATWLAGRSVYTHETMADRVAQAQGRWIESRRTHESG
ncbi:glycosyltransferase family 2 protein [Thiomonas sp.]